MDVYHQAACILRKVEAYEGTPTALCLAKEVQKKKQTYAVVCEVLKNRSFLDAIISSCHALQKERQTASVHLIPPNSTMATSIDDDMYRYNLLSVMLYDFVIGKGLPTTKGYGWFLQHHAIAVRSTANRHSDLRGITPIASEQKARTEESVMGSKEGNALETEASMDPVCMRINGCHPDASRVTDALLGHAALDPNDDAQPDSAIARHHRSYRLDASMTDILWLLPTLASHVRDLHRFPSVRRGILIPQHYVSCLPARALYETWKNSDQARDTTRRLHIVDACAAPGNKTTHLASLFASDSSTTRPLVHLTAIERDPQRFLTLQARLQLCLPTWQAHTGSNAHDSYEMIRGDFLEYRSDSADCILLDPSCSGGIAGHHGTRADTHDPGQDERVKRLALVQRRLLRHALLHVGPRVRWVSYSTCSAQREENEQTLSAVLNDPEVQAQGWTIAQRVLPWWTVRGEEPYSEALRSEAPNPFFVAIIQRDHKDSANPSFIKPITEVTTKRKRKRLSDQEIN